MHGTVLVPATLILHSVITEIYKTTLKNFAIKINATNSRTDK